MLPAALETLISRYTSKEMAFFFQELSRRYRERAPRLIDSEELRAAYLITRFPATCAAIQRVLGELKGERVSSFLDLGAGPGTGLWAVHQTFSEIAQITCIEKDRGWKPFSQALVAETSFSFATWRWEDACVVSPLDRHDLVLLSYVLNEVKRSQREALFEKAWTATGEFLVVIEPGTPEGFSGITELRKWLLERGAHLFAPCSHEGVCPMQGGDWCHFSTRLPRLRSHRLAKSAALGYEDEKFSYLIASKNKRARTGMRILRSPERHAGHIQFVLCSPEEVTKKILSRKEGELYQRCKKLEWGDLLD